MKRFLFFLAVLFNLTMTSAQILLTEPFDYAVSATDGLPTQSSGAWVRLNTGDSILLTSGSLNYTGLLASTGNKVAFDGSGSEAYRSFTSQTTGSVYVSFLLNVSSLGTLGTTGGYFASFVQAASTSTYGGAIWTRASTTAGKYNVGVSSRSNTAASWVSLDLTPGTTYFVVAALDLITGTGNDVARIWVNTTAIGGSEPTADATSAPSTTDLTSADKILLRQDNATNTPFIELDELKIGTTWASVTPASAVTPSLTTSTLTAFGDICLNTTAGPNSFTITGSNLTSGAITVGALAGFSYSTTATGTYTSTLTISNTGGSLSQEVFVKFTPTAVQSYSGSISISGGGVSAAVQVSASGAGVNTLASVTTGASSNLTQTGATLAGAITANGCGTVTAYGIEYSTTNGFANGAGTQAASSNLSGGNFSASLSSLTAGTTYYYKAYATTGAGTSYGAQQSFTTASPNPVISASTLTAFGNACINTTSAANSFTITGTNLSTANVEVAALAGYSYSLTSGGTYTSTLSITQSGGSFSQQVFVKFTPTAAQSYAGNIAITGGGVSTAVNVAASGTGVNTAATVTTGNSSSITVSAATLAGSIGSNGCSSVTAYGIEYSTTNGFANGAGTRVASTNLSAGAFTSSLTGLAASTTYYYKAYATNSGGTSYGAQQSFTTSAPPPPAITLSTLGAFSNTCVGSFDGPNSFTITGANLTSALITVGPLNGFTFSQTATGTYSDVIGILQTGGSQVITVYVRFTPTAAQTYSGNIPVNGGGATTTGVAASGVGVNTPASVTTGAATGITTSEVTLSATFNNDGCSAVTGYGIEYSSVNGFTNGTGTRIVGTGAVAGNFSTTVSGLVPGATYYYKGYVTTSGAVNYGVQRSFTVASLANKFSVFPSPALRGSEVRITKASLAPGNYTAQFINQQGQLVFQQQFNVQSTYINQTVLLPATMPFGLYRVVLANQDQQFETITILVQ